jgi:hypothetical protein
MSVDYKCHIFEEVNVSEYKDEDFIEAFVMEFRPWIRKNHGDEVGEYPMSLLVKKYIKEFSTAIGFPESRVRYYGNTLQQMRAIGVEIVTSGMRKLPSLSKDYLFTEKFKKIIDYFISSYNLPDFIKVHLEETSPFRVRGWISSDFELAMKYKGSFDEILKLPVDIKNLINNYLGLSFGSPVHGDIDFYFESGVRFENVDEWVKNVLNKKIKKEVKTLPNKNVLHSMKFSANGANITGVISLIYSRNTWYSNQHIFKEEIKEYLKNLGYNNRLEVTNH